MIRFRTPLLSPLDTAGYLQRLLIFWRYAEQGSGTLPTSDDDLALGTFEERLSRALEHDGHAIIAAIITSDGTRQWIVYTRDIHECGERIAAMPQNEQPYPIEMEADEDPEWSYLREEVLSSVSPGA